MFSEQLLEKDLTYKLRGIFIDISKCHGCYYKEAVYQNLICKSLNRNNFKFIEHPRLLLFDYQDKNKMGNFYPDFLIENKVILEIKALKELTESHVNQLMRYIMSSMYEVGLLVNFGTPKAEIFRRVYSNSRKPFLSDS